MKMYNSKGQMCGEYSHEYKAYRRVVNRKKHFMVKDQSWGIDTTILLKLSELGCHVVILKEGTSMQEMCVRLRDFFRHGVEMDYGHGAQFFLAERYFQTRDT